MERILVCTDGEEHTIAAEERAVELAERFGATVTGLYVLSPFLEKFTHEIYAVNRNECRAHLSNALKREGEAALEALGKRCAARGVAYVPRMRHGEISDEIVSEAAEGGYDLLIMGAKLLKNWRERLESCKVPEDVFKRASIPMMFVR